MTSIFTLVQPCARKASAKLGMSFSKGECSPGASTRGRLITPLLRCVEFLIRRKSPIDLQRGAQMFRSGISPGIAGDIRVTKGVAVEKMAEVNSFTPGNQLFRQVRRLLKMDMPNNGISFNGIPRPKTRDRGIEQHHAAAGFRIPADESIGHHSTNIVSNDIHVFQM